MTSIHIEGQGDRSVGSIYCIGRSYAEHARELGNPPPPEPVVFLKASAALRPLSSGPLAFPDETFHHEAEIVLAIGANIPLGAKPSWDMIDAIGLGLDLTRRGVQSQLKKKGLPWTTAKSFAGSALVSEFLPLSVFGDQPQALRFSLHVNGELRQQGDSSMMIFPLLSLVQYLASLNPLAPGDLVFTGTPPGVGPIKKGDRLDLAFTELGKAFTGVL